MVYLIVKLKNKGMSKQLFDFYIFLAYISNCKVNNWLFVLVDFLTVYEHSVLPIKQYYIISSFS